MTVLDFPPPADGVTPGHVIQTMLTADPVASLIEAQDEVRYLRSQLAESEALVAGYAADMLVLESQPSAGILAYHVTEAMRRAGGVYWRDLPDEPYRSIDEVLRGWT